MILTALTNFLHRHISTTQYFVDTGDLIHKSDFPSKVQYFQNIVLSRIIWESILTIRVNVIKHLSPYLTNGPNKQECLSQ
jgi:hypothetical protein